MPWFCSGMVWKRFLQALQLPRGSLSGCHPSASPLPILFLPLPGGDRALSWETREHSWVTSPGMQEGPLQGPGRNKNKMSPEQLACPFYHCRGDSLVLQGTEEFTEIAEKIVSDTTHLRATPSHWSLATPQCLQLLFSKATLSLPLPPKHCCDLGHVTQPFGVSSNLCGKQWSLPCEC